MELSSTAYVILGYLGLRPMSGYEIKSFVDRSSRFFWAASYGQIYPELRRLAEMGLIEGESRPQGERARTVYRLTGAGRRELRDWLAEAPHVFELRDEGLLKLFFADAAAPGTADEILAAKRRYHLEMVKTLEAIEPKAAAAPERFPHLACRYGIECHQWAADWCERTARELAAETDRLERRTA
jgi:PadR family transcriptional regulator, regulatory protein AphA